jgi:hypothetical protein
MMRNYERVVRIRVTCQPKNIMEDQSARSRLCSGGNNPDAVKSLKAKRVLNSRGLSADIAIAGSCVACQNTYTTSPKKDFKKGDVYGGHCRAFQQVKSCIKRNAKVRCAISA